MQLLSPQIGLLLALCTTTFALQAQQPGEVSIRSVSTDHRILLRYGAFDPLLGTLEVPATLRSASDTNLWIVQFPGPATDADREAIRSIGGRIVQYMPNDGYVVHMSQASAASCAVLKEVRWVGPYEPAFRVEPFLFQEHVTGAVVPVRKYNMVMADKRNEKRALEAAIVAMGGKVTDRHIDGLLFTAELTGAQLLIAARLDEVLWIDRWTPREADMNNARIQGGANAIETAGGYTGSGIRGHIYEGVEFNHSDFNTALTNVSSGGEADDHGHCTAGIVFGNGTSHANARGMAPNAVGFYTNYNSDVGSRNSIINTVVNTHSCMFTTASWGGGTTTAYTSTSADADDIVFDHRIPWTNSMSNLGNQNVRPEAWAKNVISIGGVDHQDNSTAADDSWLSGNGSTGLAADGRIKPDLSAYYENVWTSDRTGAAGYSALNYTTSFSGTSSATPIVAGHNALAIQMYTDHLFNSPPRVEGGSRFQNRPYAQTLKALMIAGARLYTPTATDNRREHVGWGFPSLIDLYNRRSRYMVIPEDNTITQGATDSYTVNVLSGETTLKVVMSYLDPQGTVAAAIDRINDLTLRVIAPNGTTSYWGNRGLSGASQTNVSLSGGSANSIDTVECVILNNPTPGHWTIEITAPIIATDAHVATGAVDATYALVVNGGTRVYGSGCARYLPNSDPNEGGNVIPFGTTSSTTLPTIFTSNNSSGTFGTMFYNVSISNALYVTGLDINTNLAVGGLVHLDVYRTALGGGYGGNEMNPAAWTPISTGHGISAGSDLPTTIELTQPMLLSVGSYGIAVVANNFIHRYTTGTGANQIYSDANLQITTGAHTGGAFSGTLFSPRVANTNLRYLLEDSTWVNQRYQTILRRGDLQAAGTIRGLMFAANTSHKHWNRSLLIRMSHVPAGHTMSTTFATNLPTPVTVLNSSNYTWHADAELFREIGLQGSFAYNGTSDLVIDVVALGNVASIDYGSFNSSPSGERVFNYGWSGATPTTGTYNDSSALRMKVNFSCGDGNEFGASCGLGFVDHTGSGAHGTAFQFHLHNGVPSSASIIALGFNNGSPYPLSLSSSGFTNCYSWNDAIATVFYLSDVGGFAAHAIALPNVTTYDGLKIYGQWYQLDPTQPGGLAASAYTRLLIGVAP